MTASFVRVFISDGIELFHFERGSRNDNQIVGKSPLERFLPALDSVSSVFLERISISNNKRIEIMQKRSDQMEYFFFSSLKKSLTSHHLFPKIWLKLSLSLRTYSLSLDKTIQWPN